MTDKEEGKKEKMFCPICSKEIEVQYVRKADVDLKICKSCGAAISILYKES
jgi:ribosome-binding protein aMBF1 (putative translation factor)